MKRNHYARNRKKCNSTTRLALTEAAGWRRDFALFSGFEFNANLDAIHYARKKKKCNSTTKLALMEAPGWQWDFLLFSGFEFYANLDAIQQIWI
jgi:hypothetical protein